MKKYCQTIFSLLLVLGIWVSSAKAVEAAYFTLNPASGTNSVGEQFDVLVGIQSGTDKVYAADIWATFDASKLEVVSIVKGFDSNNLPSGSPLEFISVASKNFDNNAGTITASIQNLQTSSYQTMAMDNQPILKVTFKAKAVGVANLSFTCSAGSTNDCNVLNAESYDDVIVCSSNQSGSYTIESGTGGETTAPTSAPATTTTTTELPQTGMVEYTIGFMVLAVILLGLSVFMFA